MSPRCLTCCRDSFPKELNLIEEQLKIFQEEASIFNLDDNSKNLLENLKEFETIYNKTLAEKSIIEERKKSKRIAVFKDFIIEKGKAWSY